MKSKDLKLRTGELNKMIRTILRYTIALCLLPFAGIGSTGPALATQQDIRVISMNEREVILEMTLPSFRMETVQGPDGTYRKIRLDGWAKTSEAGRPELPIKAVLLQAPEEGGMALEVLETAYETWTNCQIYPVPKLGLSDNGEPTTVFVKDADVYGASTFYPGELAAIGSRSVFRGTPVAQLKIYPFQWNSKTKELRYHKKIRLKIQLEDPSFQSTINNQQSTIPEVPAFESFKKSTIINFSKTSQTAVRQSTFINQQSSILSQSLRMEIREEGIYRLTYEDLTGAGLPAGIDVRTFQLFNLGNEAAMKVEAAGINFSPGDYLEFYAQAVDNQFTGINVYWLYWGIEPGKRMGEIDGTVTGGGIRPSSFTDTLHIEENHTLWEGMPGAPEADFWFWEKMTAPRNSDYVIDIPSPDTTVAEATVKVCFRGRSTAVPHPNHHTLIYLNGTKIGDIFWDGDIEYVQEMTVSPGLFMDGGNTLTISCPGDTGAVVDIVYFNWIEVEYARYFEALDDELKFTVSGDGRLEIQVQGLTGPDITLFDITDPGDVKEVINLSIALDGPSFKATFEDQVAGARTYYILTAGRIKQPEGTTLWHSAGLDNPANRADWIVITAKDFLDSVEPLRLLREARGFRVKVVSIEDIYDEFNYGLTDPKAIKGFLQYAYANWEPPAPTYIFLIGDANTDYRDYFGSGKRNIVPPHLCHTSLGVTPTDNWYVCMDGPDDVLPDMFIGRIPGSGPEMVAWEIDKIVGFEISTWPAQEKVLLVADNGDATFEGLNEDLIPYLPPEFGVNRVYLSAYASVADATRDIISRIDEGMVITNYVGHGSVTNWAGEYLFDSGDVPALTNWDRPTFVTAMTCLNGYFSQPYYYCLAEEFVAAQDKGAIGSFAPSGLGYIWEHEILDTQLFSILFDEKNSILGSLTTQAKIAAYGLGVTEDVVRTFTLFGDPASRLKVAANDRVEPIMRANGFDGPLLTAPDQAVEITASLFPGTLSGVVCDWWVGGTAPFGTYWFEPSLGWLASSTPVSAGRIPLFELSSTSLLDMELPLGIYTFSFVLDKIPNSAFDDLSGYDYVNVISSHGTGLPGDIVPDIKANGADSEVVVSPAQSLNVTVSLAPGVQPGVNCDWWIGALTPFGTFWYDVSLGWVLSETPVSAVTIPLFQLPSTALLDSTLPYGIYTFFFILDQIPNGVLDDVSRYDLVNVVCAE